MIEWKSEVFVGVNFPRFQDATHETFQRWIPCQMIEWKSEVFVGVNFPRFQDATHETFQRSARRLGLTEARLSSCIRLFFVSCQNSISIVKSFESRFVKWFQFFIYVKFKIPLFLRK